MPVRNVIFDLGGVLLEWNPRAILERCYADPGEREAVRAILFGHPDWLAFDRGELTESAMIARAAARSGRAPEELRGVVDVVRESLVERAPTVQLLHELAARGVPLFCLSNMPESVFSHLRSRCAFLAIFRGIVISGEARVAKPDPRVFRLALQRFGIEAADSVFIDDSPANIASARAVGLEGIIFEDAAQCRAELARHLPVRMP